MGRNGLDRVDTEGDFALGMGIAIGMFIALFAVGIAWFVLEQGNAAPATRAPARDGNTIAMPAETSTVSTTQMPR